MQWSAGNVDHNISTLDGTGSFHGMGITSISVAESGASNSIVETEETLFNNKNIYIYISDSPDEVVAWFYCRDGLLLKAEAGVKGNTEEF